MLSVVGKLNSAETFTELIFSDGRVVRLPTALLGAEQPSKPVGEALPLDGQFVVPLIEEQLAIAKRTVATATVHLEKTVEAFDITLNESLAVNSWNIERVAVGQVMEVEPTVRQEGATTVYPLLEERLVLTKQLILVEEIRVTRETSEQRDTRTVTLRREHLNIEREELSAK